MTYKNNVRKTYVTSSKNLWESDNNTHVNMGGTILLRVAEYTD